VCAALDILGSAELLMAEVLRCDLWLRGRFNRAKLPPFELVKVTETWTPEVLASTPQQGKER
jgi:hypothetical protein